MSAGTSGTKRKLEDIIVDPDTLKSIEESKKPKIDFDATKKFPCISAIIQMYEYILMGVIEAVIGDDAMEVDEKDKTKAPTVRAYPDINRNITVGNHIISIIFTLHNTCRQELRKPEANMIKKTTSTSFKVMCHGKEIVLTTETAKAKWIEVVEELGLKYDKFAEGDTNDWFGTMGPYLGMFSAYALRIKELRLGHNNMPLTKVDGVHKSFPVSKFGLSGAHHVLLEGTSFPPERRSSIVQSLGPMTAWLCMIRSDGQYRTKYARAVKRAMSHVPYIDDLIE